jgi:hypothetical protein
MRGSSLLALLAVPAALAAAPAAAQESGAVAAARCGEHDSVAGYLQQQFDERPVSLGLQADGRILQVFASDRTGTWTIVTTTPRGMSCIVSGGEAWEDLPHGPIADLESGGHVSPRS